MKVYCVVQIGYYDEEALISVHYGDVSAIFEAERLMEEQKKNDRPSYPRPGPYRVIEKEVLP